MAQFLTCRISQLSTLTKCLSRIVIRPHVHSLCFLHSPRILGYLLVNVTRSQDCYDRYQSFIIERQVIVDRYEINVRYERWL